MTKHFVAVLLPLSAVTSTSCSNPLNPGPVPKAPGTVTVRVSDQLGPPVANVAVVIREVPNSVGSFYSVGRSSGVDGVSNWGPTIPAGSRRVSITLPAGCVAGSDGIVRQIEVVKSASVTVTFRITRV